MTGLCLAWDSVPRTPGFAPGFLSSFQPTTAGGLITDESESHVLVLAPTGAGKGRNFIVPNLLYCDASTVVIDVKGEAAVVTADERRRMGHEVVVIDPFETVPAERGALNPLELIAEASFGDDALMLAQMISANRRGSKEPFWDDCAEDLVSGAIGQAVGRRGSLVDVWNILTTDDLAYACACLLDTGKPHPFVYKQYSAFLAHEGVKVRSSVLSTARQHLRLLAGASVQNAVARTSFSLEKLRRGEKITIYIVIPPTKLHSHSGLLRLWLSVLLGVIASRTEMPAQPTDEMAHLGAMEDLRDAVTLLRGYGLKTCLFLQSYGQLKNLFPKDHETIVENCGTIVTFGHTSMSMSATIADMLGDISASTLFNMGADQLAVRTRGEKTKVARRVDYLTDRMFEGLFAPNPYYRNKRSAAR